MEYYMTARNIILSALDCARLRDLLATARQVSSAPSRILNTLERELARARVVPPDLPLPLGDPGPAATPLTS